MSFSHARPDPRSAEEPEVPVYEPPAITYEGKVSIRAGSPIGLGPYTPWDNPDPANRQ